VGISVVPPSSPFMIGSSSLQGVGDGAAHRPVGCIQEQLVDIAPPPVFTGLIRFDDGVTGTVQVSGCMLVPGLIAAPDMPTDHAEPQVYPGVADPEAVLATRRARRDFANLAEVRTGGHGLSPCRCGSGSGRSRAARSHPARVVPTSKALSKKLRIIWSGEGESLTSS